MTGAVWQEGDCGRSVREDTPTRGAGSMVTASGSVCTNALLTGSWVTLVAVAFEQGPSGQCGRFVKLSDSG